MELGMMALIMGGISAVGSTISGIQQANAQAGAASAQAQAAENEAQTIRETADFEERQLRRRTGLLLGKQAAIGAASGLDITSGSPLFMELDNVRQAELEALNVRRTGQLGASAKEYEARLARFQGQRAKASIPGIIFGGLAQGGSVLSQFVTRKK